MNVNGITSNCYDNAAYTDTAVKNSTCLLYTSDAADEEDSVDLGGRNIIKKKEKEHKKKKNVTR